MKRKITESIPITHPAAQKYILKVFQKVSEVYMEEDAKGNLPKLNLADYSSKTKTVI